MKKIVSVILNGSWVFSKKSEPKLPIEAFAEFASEQYSATVIKKTLTECEFIFDDADIKADVFEATKAFFADKFGLTNFASVLKCRVEDYRETPMGEDFTEITAPEAEAPKAPNREELVAAVMEKINALVGAEEFKALANECVRVAPGLIKHGAVDAFTRQSYVFAINDGNGLTTYLNLFSELLIALGLLTVEGEKRVVHEDKIPAPSNERTSLSGPFDRFRGMVGRSGKGGAVYCFDISEWMTKLTAPEMRNALSNMVDSPENKIVVFRVPFVEKSVLKGISLALNDILSVRAISFAPFDNNELLEYAKIELSRRGFTMEDDAWDVFNTRINEEKSDGRFYGVNTINKIICEMIYLKQLVNADDGVDDTLVKKSEIMRLAATYNNEQKTGLAVLEGMVGMETIRNRIVEIVAQIEGIAKNDSLGSPCIHMRFVGNPGTGKTTVARVIGQILKEKGILRNGSFFEHSGRDFCGRYVGETAPKTSAMCRDAYGSVLFIDEAYSLFREGIGSVDYGREAIDTLIAEMENHRSDLVVIMAGYPEEMSHLMDANAGLESRMPYTIEFPNYTREQLFDIFMIMVNKSFTYKEGFAEAAKEYFTSLPDELVLSKEFSNARFVRNLFERTWGKAALRAQLNKEDTLVLIKEDFMLASSEKEFNKIMKKPSRTLGFI